MGRFRRQRTAGMRAIGRRGAGGWRARLPTLHSIAMVATMLLVAAPAEANRLQVAPTLIELRAGRSAEALWLTNTGTDALTAQIRVFHWRQDQDGEHLEPTPDLLVSPAQATIAAGRRQLVRIMRVGPVPDTERSFRIVVDELARDVAVPAAATGLQFRLRYSLPVFVSASDTQAQGPPQLRATLSIAHEPSMKTMLLMANGGLGRAQLAEVTLVGADGSRLPVSGGLLGYVLAGRAMRWPGTWPASRPVPDGLEVELRLNGEPALRRLPVRVIGPTRAP